MLMFKNIYCIKDIFIEVDCGLVGIEILVLILLLFVKFGIMVICDMVFCIYIFIFINSYCDFCYCCYYCYYIFCCCISWFSLCY